VVRRMVPVTFEVTLGTTLKAPTAAKVRLSSHSVRRCARGQLPTRARHHAQVQLRTSGRHADRGPSVALVIHTCTPSSRSRASSHRGSYITLLCETSVWMCVKAPSRNCEGRSGVPWRAWPKPQHPKGVVEMENPRPGSASDRAADSGRVRTRRNGAAATRKTASNVIRLGEPQSQAVPTVAQIQTSPTGPRPYNRIRSASSELGRND